MWYDCFLYIVHLHDFYIIFLIACVFGVSQLRTSLNTAGHQAVAQRLYFSLFQLVT